MADAMTAPLADTRDMKRVHRIFRDAFGSAVAYLGAVRPTDIERVELVAAYYDNVLRLLVVHHEGEDELLTPRLLARCTGEEAVEVARVAAQHEAVIGAIDDALTAISTWRNTPNLETAATATTTLAALNIALRDHLDDEERTVLPVAGRYVTQPEWDELPRHGLTHFTGDRIWLVVGLIQEQMTPEQVSAMETAMPAPFVEFWQQQGRPQFKEFAAALRGQGDSAAVRG